MAALVPAASAQVRASGFSDFTELYEKQGPAVVAISVTQMIKHPGSMQLPENHPPFDLHRRRGQTPRRSAAGNRAAFGSLRFHHLA